MRQCGVLLHVTSLPSSGGIGTLGKEARHFVDFCHKAGVHIWQMLPVGPTGYADSPYQSTSVFAGEELLIDLEPIADEAKLELPQDTPTDTVDYQTVRAQKDRLLRQAFERTRDAHAKELAAFRVAQPWVEDYALFTAIKHRFGGTLWTKWPDAALRRREPQALQRARDELRDEIDYRVFAQWLFRTQWDALHAYARQNDVRLFGDMPIYIAEDSVDTWMYPSLFKLDSDGRPTMVAGVPPDLFSADGQKWGNPLYDWPQHRKQGYRWWIERLRGASALFDIIRIDHFIGFANYCAIPASDATARNGRWRVGPNRPLFAAIRRELPGLHIVAEDLGHVTWRVRRLLRYCGYPCMRVASFGFDGKRGNEHLPKNFKANCFAYTGTHDNDTMRGWYASATPAERSRADAACGIRDSGDVPWAFLRAVAQSKAETAIFPMQDLLELPTEARMNIPGTVNEQGKIGGNWCWRMLPGADSDALAQRLRQLNASTARA